MHLFVFLLIHTHTHRFFQFRVLFQRNLRSYLRNKGNVAARLSIDVFVSVVAGLIFFQLGKHGDQPHIVNDVLGMCVCVCAYMCIWGKGERRRGTQRSIHVPLAPSPLFFFTSSRPLSHCSSLSFIPHTHTSPPPPKTNKKPGSIYTDVFGAALLPFVSQSIFLHDRQFFSRENAAGLYASSAYYAVNVSLEMILNALGGFLFATISYYMKSYSAFVQPENEAACFLGYVGVLTLMTLMANVRVCVCVCMYMCMSFEAM